MLAPSDLAVTRVRFPLKFRYLTVTHVVAVTPYLTRVSFTGDDLHDFESASFDDHVKLSFPAPGEDRPRMPSAGPNGPVFPEGDPRPVARDFTPRRFDREARTIDIEFALHEAGPAAQWARGAQIGQTLGIGGPRGSHVIPTGFDWHLLIGDESALPAVARRLEELPAGKRVATIIEVAAPDGKITLDTRADLYAVWRYRSEHDGGLVRAVRETWVPTDGIGYVWAAGEASAMRGVRAHLVGERGIDKSRIRAAAYWKRGAVAVHENLDD